MITRLGLIAAALCVSTTAFSQQAPSPNEQALGQKLLLEIQANVSCFAQSIVLRQEAEKIQAELKAMKEKSINEPKQQ